MNVNKLLEELYKRKSPKFTLGLGPIKRLAAALGNPQRNLRCIHIAGTNGKGSTAMYIYSVLIQAGYRVGLYISPHLKRFNERIRIGNKTISDQMIARYYQKIKKFETGQSFFEITTMMAFLFFKDRKCDFVVIETGLGGRLDATNIITPLVSVITPISKEHTKFLGTTISQIAGEKAGIIKQNIPVLTNNKGVSLSVIGDQAKRKSAPLITCHKKHSLVTSLSPSYQQENASLAIHTLQLLMKNKVVQVKNSELEKGITTLSWPGRYQFVSKNVLLDGAHNPGSMKKLVDEVSKLPQKKVFVLSILGDKDARNMLRLIKKTAREVVMTQVDNPRALSPSFLASRYSAGCYLCDDPQKAVVFAKKLAGNNGMVVVTGSLYLVAQFV